MSSLIIFFSFVLFYYFFDQTSLDFGTSFLLTLFATTTRRSLDFGTSFLLTLSATTTRRGLDFGTSFLSTLFAMAIAIAYSVFLSHCFAMACWRMCESFHLKKRHIDFCRIKEQAIAKQCGVITKKPRFKSWRSTSRGAKLRSADCVCYFLLR